VRSLDPVPVLKAVVPVLDVVGYNKYVAQRGFVEETKPGQKIRLMYCGYQNRRSLFCSGVSC
jgi:hypothetical protein